MERTLAHRVEMIGAGRQTTTVLSVLFPFHLNIAEFRCWKRATVRFDLVANRIA